MDKHSTCILWGSNGMHLSFGTNMLANLQNFWKQTYPDINSQLKCCNASRWCHHRCFGRLRADWLCLDVYIPSARRIAAYALFQASINKTYQCVYFASRLAVGSLLIIILVKSQKCLLSPLRLCIVVPGCGGLCPCASWLSMGLNWFHGFKKLEARARSFVMSQVLASKNTCNHEYA